MKRKKVSGHWKTKFNNIHTNPYYTLRPWADLSHDKHDTHLDCGPDQCFLLRRLERWVGLMSSGGKRNRRSQQARSSQTSIFLQLRSGQKVPCFYSAIIRGIFFPSLPSLRLTFLSEAVLCWTDLSHCMQISCWAPASRQHSRLKIKSRCRRNIGGAPLCTKTRAKHLN